MTDEMDPRAQAALQAGTQFRSLLEDQISQANNETFKATDEAKTVAATLTGQHFLTDLHIDEELLRLGAETVAQRINEALRNARTAATAGSKTQGERLVAALSEITRALTPIAESMRRAHKPDEVS